MIRAAVLGSDVSKSRSPAIHRAAFRALGVKGTYEALSVDADGFAALVADLRARGFRYLNVTIPHKAAAAALSKRLGPEARAAGAVNTLIFEKAGVRGENTDGAGLLAALADLGFKPRGARVVMVGSGGAASGAVEALTRAGAKVHLLARASDRAQARALHAHVPAARRSRVTTATWTPKSLSAALKGANALVSAVPAVAWDEAAVSGLATLGRGTAVLEMPYGGTSPLARAALARTPLYTDGLGILAYQAGRAVELALGKAPPAAGLLRAARRG
jgi:shikimate dehydrogenase